MSECCRGERGGNEKLRECCVKSVREYFNKIDERQEEDAAAAHHQEKFHIFGGGQDGRDEPDNKRSPSTPPLINCHHHHTTDECEVRLIKEWLILQTDLIQQQNDDIIDKDRQIYILRRENEMLKERINTIEKEICVQIEKEEEEEEEEQQQSPSPSDSSRCCWTRKSSPGGEMTQSTFEEDDHLANADKNEEGIEEEEEDVSCGGETSKRNVEEQPEKKRDESQIVVVVDNNNSVKDQRPRRQFVLNDSKEIVLSEFGNIRSYSNDTAISNCERIISDYNYLVNICDSDTDPKNNLRMSITRKRVCSNSSASAAAAALSPNESAVTTTTEEKEPHRRFKKKKRRITKEVQTLTSMEPYITQAQEVDLGITSTSPDIPNTALEIPRWRHKIYPSCYTMEGTENLDDQVFNKRHLRLEINERRRKRWDVQRIREQRVIEKLKQRQERMASGSKGEETEPLPSLWPRAEDIKYLQISDELPVSAFGTCIPKLTSCEFSLPWLGNSSTTITKKASYAKRSTVRKRYLRR